MPVDLSACVQQIFDTLDIDDMLTELARPAEAEVELTGRPQVQPQEAPATR